MRALEECKALVFILSNDSNESDQVLTELETAKDRRIPIIPVFIHKVDLSYDVKYFIRSHQWIEAVDMALEKVVTKILSSLEGTIDVPHQSQPATSSTKQAASGEMKSTEAPTKEEIQEFFGIVFDKKAKPEKTKSCRFLVHDRVITSLDGIPAIAELDGKENRLIIIDENFEGEAEKYLQGAEYQGITVLGVKAPGFGDAKKSALQDIAVCTGSVLISDEKGFMMEKTSLKQLGLGADIRVNHEVEAEPDNASWHTGSFTTIIGGKAKPETLKPYLDELKGRIERTSSGYDTEKMQRRLESFANIEFSPYLGHPDVSDYTFAYKE